MITSVEGVYRDGKVELLEPAADRAETSRVVVTFLPPPPVVESALGMTPQQAAELRTRVGGIAEDWDHSDMDVYDDLPPR